MQACYFFIEHVFPIQRRLWVVFVHGRVGRMLYHGQALDPLTFRESLEKLINFPSPQQEHQSVAQT